MESGSEGFKKINQSRKKNAGQGRPSNARERYTQRRLNAIARNSAQLEQAPF